MLLKDQRKAGSSGPGGWGECGKAKCGSKRAVALRIVRLTPGSCCLATVVTTSRANKLPCRYPTIPTTRLTTTNLANHHAPLCNQERFSLSAAEIYYTVQSIDNDKEYQKHRGEVNYFNPLPALDRYVVQVTHHTMLPEFFLPLFFLSLLSYDLYLEILFVFSRFSGPSSASSPR